jgi:hypothetical protein
MPEDSDSAMPNPERYRLAHRPYRHRYSYVYRGHVFDKLRSIDLGLAEFQALLGSGTVIEELAEDALDHRVHEFVLLVSWLRPLHVVILVDVLRREERLVTVYEPDLGRWTPDFTRRRR